MCFASLWKVELAIMNVVHSDRQYVTSTVSHHRQRDKIITCSISPACKLV